MARRPTRQTATPQPKQTATADSFQNFQSALGMGANNAISGADYGLNPVTRTRVRLEFAYRGSWVVGMAVDAPAEDMCRAGIEIESDLDPEANDLLQSQILDLNIWGKLTECLKWARLYGGCLGYLMIDGQDPQTPFDIETVGEGQFRGIMPLDRWMVQANMSDIITDLGPNFGNPKYYDIVADQTGFAGHWGRIHHSRVLRFTGIDLPFNQRLTENGWGESVVERIWDRLIAYDSTSAGAAQLVYKAHLRIMKVENLRQIIAAGGPAMAGLTAQMANMRLTQANEGITLLDTTDEFEVQQYAFSGVSDMMLQFAQQIAGALQIPLVRLLGQSPAGLNSTGESDLRTYYDHLAKQQEQKLRAPLIKILDILSRSVLGAPLPSGTKFKFNPLWLVTEEERADLGTKTTDNVIKAFESGLIGQQTALKELRQSSHVTGLFTNITDEDINAADIEPPSESDIMPTMGDLGGLDD